TSTNTTQPYRIRHFADRRLTRFTSVEATRFQQTWRHARPPHAEHAWKPTDPRPAGGAHPSTRPHDHRQPTTGLLRTGAERRMRGQTGHAVSGVKNMRGG